MRFPTTLDTTAWMPHVLAAIRHLGPHGEEVRFRDVLSDIEALTDFPGWDTWGTKMKRGKPYFAGHRAITLTAGRLKKDGMITSPRRGYYALTEGVAAESPVVEETPIAPTPEVEITAPEIPETPETPETVLRIEITVKDDGVCYLPPTGAVTHESYATEADLRRVAIDSTRCFGLWSSRSAQCRECPLAGLCQATSMSALATVAAELDAEFVAEVAKAEVAKAEAEATLASERARLLTALSGVAASDTTTDTTTDTTAVVSYKTVTVPFACVCSAEGCSGTVEANTSAAHVEGRGVFHIECADALTP
jgi:hypothetical protein